MAHVFWNRVLNDLSRSSKVVDFDADRKREYALFQRFLYAESNCFQS